LFEIVLLARQTTRVLGEDGSVARRISKAGSDKKGPAGDPDAGLSWLG
jgi:hypothetical protein